MWCEVVGAGEARAADIARHLASRAIDGPPPAPGPDSVAEPGVVVAAGSEQDLLLALDRHRAAARRILVVLPDVRDSGGRRDAWRLLAAGATDVVTWQGEESADAVAARLQRWADVDRAVLSDDVQRVVRGRSTGWMALLRQLVEAARFTSAPLLLTGESGTGKELAAGLVHALDPRSPKGRFVVVDCTTVVPTLSGSEFFGHERGAFTGAIQAREGAFGLADGGTLFLDEVGELPPTMQAELLRVIQEGAFKKVGSSRWERSSFRLVCATNRDIPEECRQGRFRRDLYYRIAGVELSLPSLRERHEDVLPMFLWFLAERLPGDRTPTVTPEVAAYVQGRRYAGNVRELRQLAGRVALRHVGPGPITVGDIPDDERPHEATAGTWDRSGLAAAVSTALAAGLTLGEIERAAGDAALETALRESANRVSGAATKLGVSDRAIQYRLRAKGTVAASAPRTATGATGRPPPSAATDGAGGGDVDLDVDLDLDADVAVDLDLDVEGTHGGAVGAPPSTPARRSPTRPRGARSGGRDRGRPAEGDGD